MPDFIFLILQGTGCEMYTETLSTSFIGMTFSQAAETCFVKVISSDQNIPLCSSAFPIVS